MNKKRSRSSGLGGLVSTRFNFWILSVIRERLSSSNISALRQSSIGHLVDMANLQFQGQLYIVMCRMLQIPSQNGHLTYKIGDSLVTFGPGDHALISGLKMCGSRQLPATSRFHDNVFTGVNNLNFSDIHRRFLQECDTSRGNSDLSLKLALLCIVYGLLVTKDRSTSRLELGYMHLLDDFEKFNDFPWGRVTYDELVMRSFSAKACIDGHEGKNSPLRIEARGFVFVLQAWAYEVLPDLGAYCAKYVMNTPSRCARILRWMSDVYFEFDDLFRFFQSSSLYKPASIVVSCQEWCMLKKLGISTTTSFASVCHEADESLDKVSNNMELFRDLDAANASCALENTVQAQLRRSERVSSQHKRNQSIKIGVKYFQDDHDPCMFSSSFARFNDKSSNGRVSGTSPNVAYSFILNAVMQFAKSIEIKFESRFCGLEKRLQQTERIVAELRESKIDCRITSGVQVPMSTDDPNMCSVQSPKASPAKFISKLVTDEAGSGASIGCEEIIGCEFPLKSNCSSDLSLSKNFCRKSERIRQRKTQSSQNAKCSNVALPFVPIPNLVSETAVVTSKFGHLSKTETMVFKSFAMWQGRSLMSKSSEVIRLPSELMKYADSEWFDNIKLRRKCLRNDHIEALLYLVSLSYPQDRMMGSVYEWTFLEMFVADCLKSDNVDLVRGQLRPFVSGCKPCKRPVQWNCNTRVYGVLNVCGNHWVLFELNLVSQCITVYDSLCMEWALVSKEFKNMAITLPTICREANLLNNFPLKSTWDIAPFPKPPQQVNTSDCGIMVMKYLECLLYALPLTTIEPELCGIYRHRFCCELYSYGIGNQN